MKAICIGAIVLVLSSVMAGCGIAQDKYDAAIGERDSVKSQAVSLQGDLDKAKTQTASLQGDLDKARALVTSGQSDLEKARTQVASTQGDMEKAKGQIKSLQDELAIAKTKYYDLEASTSKQINALKQDSAKLKKLTVFNLKFCSAKPEPDKYIEKPGSTYRVGETVWVYFEVFGQKWSVTDANKLQANIETEYRLLNDRGELVTRLVTTYQKDDYNHPVQYVWYWKDYVGLKAGNYTLEVAVVDKLTGETTSAKGDFKVTA